MKGELFRLDLSEKMLVIRVENGMAQTFKFDDNTIVTGLERPPKGNAAKSDTTRSSVRNLRRKLGSEVTVHWQDQNEAKIARNIEVTHVASSKYFRRSRRR
jgi:hypothetical protein